MMIVGHERDDIGMMIIMKMMMMIVVMIRLHQDEDSWTALHAASANGHHRIAESV